LPPPLDRILLAEIALFHGLGADDLDDILAHARSRRFAKNVALFEQGAGAEHFFVLLDGHLKVTQTTPVGAQVIVRYINPGDIFGIAAAIGRSDYPATATAVVDSVALAWDQHYWGKLVTAHPSVAGNVMRTLGARLQDQQEKLMQIATQRAERRIAHVLLRLVRQAGKKVEGGIEISFPLTRQDIAEMTGTTLFTVSRVMSQWDQASLTESGRQRIVVRDPHALLRIAEESAETADNRDSM
jgi:CRP-like cAMP-binding protein